MKGFPSTISSPPAVMPWARPGLDQDAADLAIVEQEVVGPLETDAYAARFRSRDAGGEAKQRIGLEDKGHEKRGARRRLPAPLHPPATRGLVVGDDDRTDRQLARHVLRRSDRIQTQDLTMSHGR